MSQADSVILLLILTRGGRSGKQKTAYNRTSAPLWRQASNAVVIVAAKKKNHAITAK